MILGHMFGNGAVLPLTTVKPAVGGNAVMAVKNLDGFVCNPHIDLAFYIFIRN